MQEFVEQRELGVVLMEGFTTRIALGETIRRRVPDVLFVAQDRLHLLRKTHLEGPPDLIVEVVSPDSVARDWREKYQDYESAGVREYWVVDPLAERVEASSLGEDGKYVRLPESDGVIHSSVLTGFFLKTAWLFAEDRPKTRAVLAELGIE
jgi:Uma2 family endonuclease